MAEFHKLYKHEHEHLLKIVQDEIIRIQKRIDHTIENDLIERACDDAYKQHLKALLSGDTALKNTFELIRQKVQSILDCGECKEALEPSKNKPFCIRDKSSGGDHTVVMAGHITEDTLHIEDIIHYCAKHDIEGCDECQMNAEEEDK
jgi:hypothetical protein